MKILNTLEPYKVLDTEGGIQYGVCRDFSHVSRYRGLRQVTHCPDVREDRFVAFETPNPFTTHTYVKYYDVPEFEENRLDLIAYKFLGDATYAWVLAYFNHIEDGFTVKEGQRLMIPNSITDLFNKGEMLAPINPTKLNLGGE